MSLKNIQIMLWGFASVRVLPYVVGWMFWISFFGWMAFRFWGCGRLSLVSMVVLGFLARAMMRRFCSPSGRLGMLATIDSGSLVVFVWDVVMLVHFGTSSLWLDACFHLWMAYAHCLGGRKMFVISWAWLLWVFIFDCLFLCDCTYLVCVALYSFGLSCTFPFFVGINSSFIKKKLLHVVKSWWWKPQGCIHFSMIHHVPFMKLTCKW